MSPDIGGAAGHRRPGGVEHLRPHGGHRRQLRGTAHGQGPVRIGLPLDGWDLAVVDPEGRHVEPGAAGELIIGGVGLARYLDPDKDAEKFATMPTLGWDRAYRSGDIVRYDEEGLIFVGRADEQIKLGGRRIELGEIDNTLLDLPGVTARPPPYDAAAAASSCSSATSPSTGAFDHKAAVEQLRTRMPAAMVPRLAMVETLPTKTSGKIDRDALPWPVETGASPASAPSLPGTAGWVQSCGADPGGRGRRAPADFFDNGGGSLSAAQLVSRLRERFPEVTVADVYEHPTVGDLAARLDLMAAPSSTRNRRVRPVPLKTQVGQVLSTFALRTLSGLRWVTWTAAGNNVAAGLLGLTWLPTLSWWWVIAGWLLLVSATGPHAGDGRGRPAPARRVGAGEYPRGGRSTCGSGWPSAWPTRWVSPTSAVPCGCGSTPGCSVRRWARTWTCTRYRPSPGCSPLATACSIEPEVDLSGHWLDGDVLHLGRVTIGANARVGGRSMLCPGVSVGAGRGGARVGGVRLDPAGRGLVGCTGAGGRAGPRPLVGRHPARTGRLGARVRRAGALIIPSCRSRRGRGSPWPSPAVAVDARRSATRRALRAALPAAPRRARARGAGRADRAAWSGSSRSGWRAVTTRSTAGSAWQAWSVLRVLDEARTWLFPLYSSTLTPAWLRALGARIGSGVEASTVLLIPTLTTVSDGAFLADDTLLGGYELGGGWLRVEQVKVGKHAFVGNSGMTAPGRKVPKRGAGGRAVGGAASDQGQGGHVVARQPADPAAPARPRTVDDTRTYNPPSRLRVARALVEVLPAGAGRARRRHRARRGAPARVRSPSGSAGLPRPCSPGVVLMVAGALAAGVTTAAKWVLVGPRRVSDHPLWSSFVWRNELADTFVEVDRRALVRAGRDRHPGAERLAAFAGRADRQGGLVRDLLAARGRPGRAARRGDGQPGLRRADAPVPRPGAEHGHGSSSARAPPSARTA